MSHPTKSNPVGSKSHHAAAPSTTSHHSIHQSHSFSSYHPPPHPPSGYYYHASGPYPPPPPQHAQHPQLSPIPVHYSAHHHPYHPYHHHQQQQQQPQHVSSPATPWPTPPSSSTAENMDTSHDGTPPSPPAIATSGATSLSEEAPSPPLADNNTSADAFAASTLSSLANASTSPSSSPLSSSAGPLKKRRKVAKDANQATATETTSVHDSSSSLSATNFPCMLHKLLAKGDDTNLKDSVISSSVEWMSHGKGWRVLRWDAFCTDVLPKEFPKLCHELFQNGGRKGDRDDEIREDERDDNPDISKEKEAGEYTDEQWVEAFLWHLKAWGFEEVVAGRDRGSFRHQLFLRDSPELCNRMKMNRPRSNSNSMVAHTPHTYYNTEIGHSTSSFDASEHANTASWRKSHKVVSSIFKPRRTTNSQSSHHPTHLHVPVLTSASTASFVESTWGSEHNSDRCHHQYFQSQCPPPTRSPKTIRFRDEPSPPFHRSRDDAVEITPNPEASPTTSRRKQYGGFVSRRGRRPALITRHATH